ncbi:CAZyme family CE10 [Agaricus bisporus var. burnettii]|uniref:CAZyme family CE10 n=1 Tax=Agaricus bisporus var. burnettii TaxID=192524 RepID=A0A8H7F8M0_AGABI|nr:CAZyme family CE10 [Agaricus bisporus var. burnettii]
MTHAYSKQPWRALFLAYQLAALFVRFPLWLLLALPRSLRPRQSWDVRRTVLVYALRHLFHVQGQTGRLRPLPDHRAIPPGNGVNGVWVPPLSEELVLGKLRKWAEHVNAVSIPIPGYWMHKKGTSIDVASTPLPGEKVILTLHGGGYTQLSAHPNDVSAAIPRGLLKHVKSVNRLLSLEYRLSSAEPFSVAHPFPTALLDALAGYVYLVNVVGFSPSNIIIEGDSAGANLAQSLTRYLTEYKGTPGLPMPPGSLLLLSPWADLGKSHDNLPAGSASTCIASDYIPNPSTPHFRYAVRAMVGPHGLEEAEINPYISPASLNPTLTVHFKDFPRTFIVAGGAEVLLDQIRSLRDKMVRDVGEGNGTIDEAGKVRYLEVPDGIHDYLIFSWHEPERTHTLKAIAEWIDFA